MSFCRKSSADSRQLLILAVAAAVWLAQDTTSETLSQLAAFFTVLGDILALFALQPELLEGVSGQFGPEPSGTSASSC